MAVAEIAESILNALTECGSYIIQGCLGLINGLSKPRDLTVHPICTAAAKIFKFIIAIIKKCSSYIRKPFSCVFRLFQSLISCISPDKQAARPFYISQRTVVLSFLFFAIGLIFFFPAIYCTNRLPSSFLMWFGYPLVVILLISVAVDVCQAWKQHSNYQYRTNQANTVLVVLFSLSILPASYHFRLHAALNHTIITTTEETVDQAYFPSIAILQQLDWTSQAELVLKDAPPKCYLGWANDAAPDCDVVTSSASPIPCRCQRNWDTEFIEPYVWESYAYRLLTLTASKEMVCTKATTKMLAQVSLKYNSTQALADNGRVLSPGLWMVVFDPTLDLTQALKGYAEMILIDANSMVAVNIGLRYRRGPGIVSAYNYELSVSTSMFQEAVKDGQIVWVALMLQIPSFKSLVMTSEQELDPLDALAEAGAWFGLITLAAWFMSLVVLAP